VSVPTILDSTDMPIQMAGTMMSDKLNCKAELWLSQLTKTASQEANIMELKLNAMLVNHASTVKYLTDKTTLVLHQDQPVLVTRLLTAKINAKIAQ